MCRFVSFLVIVPQQIKHIHGLAGIFAIFSWKWPQRTKTITAHEVSILSFNFAVKSDEGQAKIEGSFTISFHLHQIQPKKLTNAGQLSLVQGLNKSTAESLGNTSRRT